MLPAVDGLTIMAGIAQDIKMCRSHDHFAKVEEKSTRLLGFRSWGPMITYAKPYSPRVSLSRGLSGRSCATALLASPNRKPCHERPPYH